MKNKLLIGLLLTAHVSAVVANGEVIGGFTPSDSNSMIQALKKSKAAAALTEERAAYNRGGDRARAKIKPTTPQAVLDAEYDAYVKKINTYNSQQTAPSVAYQENEYPKEDQNQHREMIDIFEMAPMTKDEWMKSKSF
jgi:hypothetical protein